jgi:alpha-mannosidase
MPNFQPDTLRELDWVLSAIENAIYTVVGELDIHAWRTAEPVPFAQCESGEPLKLKIGDKWGDLFDCAWFHFTGTIPQAAAGQPVVLLLDVNGELLVVDAAGVPLRGLTNVASGYDLTLGSPGKRVLPLTTAAVGGEPVDVWADAGCNDLFGNLVENGTVKEAFIATCAEEVRALYYDYAVLLDFLKVLPADSARYQQVLTALFDAGWKLVAGFTAEAVAEARAALRPMLAQRGGDPSLTVSAIGHAHIDLGWLWPIRETWRKGARTFATVLANMERYPDYVYGSSQPQLYQWMKEGYSALYERIKQAVREGRIEPLGALWVEPDTNVTGGESLVRQFLYGKRFFRDEFGVDVRHVWLPDAFGYTAALPQLMKLAGVDYFTTQKMSWNQVNTFPHHSFHWQGIDGTMVLAHTLPEETYNSPAAPRSVARIERNYREKGVSDQAMMVFGIGDGGGGPGEEHLERLTRLKNLAGLAPVVQEPAAAFFERWAKDAARFPTWVGELYLERHAGTLTSHGRNKWYNRRLEQALRELEWMAVFADDEYPQAWLDATWQEMLLYQFHDILPGSSIKRVYDESLARYRVLLAEAEALIRRYEDTVAQEVDTTGLTAPAVAFNSLSWPRTEWVKVNVGSGVELLTWLRVTAPALGYAAFDAVAEDAIPTVIAETGRLENDCLRVTFATDGSITSVYDKRVGREALAAGERANRLAVYRDPGDAWDFPLDYADQTPAHLQLVSAEACVAGPTGVLRQVYRLGHSELTQEIVLTAGSPRLDFNTRVSWRETATMLRTSFPVAVHAEDATYEIQFGHIRRPTHRNTTWELAKDEVAGHKWADLSQRDYGVALLNDSKYGHKIKGHVIDLDLLRSMPYPGPRLVKDEDVAAGQPHHGYSDQAELEFRYALYPHTGDAVAGGVVQAAYEFNIPLRIVPAQSHAGVRPRNASFVQVDAANVIVETVKRAEACPEQSRRACPEQDRRACPEQGRRDGNEVIVRLYEAGHAGARARARFGFPVQAAEEVNLLEEHLQPVDLRDNTVELVFRPFEIKTLKLVRGNG